MKYFRIYRQRFLICFCVALTCAAVLVFGNAESMPGAAFERILRVFYFVDAAENAIGAILLIMPFMLFIICLADFFRKGIETEIIYCLTRKRNIFKLYFQKCIMLLLFSVFCVVALMAAGLAGASIFGRIPASEYVSVLLPVFYMLLLAVLFVFTFSLLANIFSLVLSTKWTISALVFVMFAVSVHFGEVAQKKSNWLWSSIANFYFQPHEEFHNYILGYEEFLLPGFKVWQSVLFFVAIIAITLSVGYYIIGKKDFGLMLED